MSVHSDKSDWTSRAKGILEQTGAEDIASASEAKADFQKTDKPMPRATDPGTRSDLEETIGGAAREEMVAREDVDVDPPRDISTPTVPPPRRTEH